MLTIQGKYHYQIKDLIEDLKEYPQDAIVFAIWHDGEGKFHERPVYKTADPGEVYLYLGDERQDA